MQRTRFDEMACSIARTWDVAGEAWTPLILRDVYVGITRFDALQRNLGLSRKVLAERLAALVGDGVLERRPYQERPERHDYELTEKGRELAVVLMALMAWGDRWTAGDAGPPVVLTHTSCGHDMVATVACSHCGEPIEADAVAVRPGPGARPGPGTSEIGAALERRAATA